MPDSIYIPQGHFEVSSDPSVHLATVLGSCVAACVWDPQLRIGGMNHLLLPPGVGAGSEGEGVHLMELLINALLKRGARKSALKVKLFGGATMFEGSTQIGVRNADFAKDFFLFEGIEVVAQSLGGMTAKRVKFWPTTGMAKLKIVAPEQVRERAPVPAPAPAASDIELF